MNKDMESHKHNENEEIGMISLSSKLLLRRQEYEKC